MATLLLSTVFLAFVHAITSDTNVKTTGDFENVYFPVNGTIRFKVKAPFDATLIFVGKLPFDLERDPYMEVGVGGNKNTRSWIRRVRYDSGIVRVRTEGFLSNTEFRGFWVKLIPPASILMGKEHEKVPFLAWTDPNIFKITHFGVGTCCGATAEWIVQDGDGESDVSPCAPDDVRTTEDPWSEEPLHIVKGTCYKMLTELRSCSKDKDNLVANKIKRYVTYEQVVRWDEAKATCERYGQKLASVRNKAEQAKLEEAMRSFKNPISGVWIGANDRGQYERFVWNDVISDPVTFTNWEAKVAPAHDNAGRNCVLVSYVALVVKSNAIWFVQKCSDTYNFVCEAYD